MVKLVWKLANSATSRKSQQRINIYWYSMKSHGHSTTTISKEVGVGSKSFFLKPIRKPKGCRVQSEETNIFVRILTAKQCCHTHKNNGKELLATQGPMTPELPSWPDLMPQLYVAMNPLHFATVLHHVQSTYAEEAFVLCINWIVHYQCRWQLGGVLIITIEARSERTGFLCANHPQLWDEENGDLARSFCRETTSFKTPIALIESH